MSIENENEYRTSAEIDAAEKGEPDIFDDWIVNNTWVLYDAFIADAEYMKVRLPTDKNKVAARRAGFKLIEDAYQDYLNGWDG